MLELILIVSALICLGVCSYHDYKYSKFFFIFPAVGIPMALAIKILMSVFSSNFWIIIDSIVMGSFFVVSGYILYKKNKWGEGDVWMVAYLFILSPYLHTIILFGIVTTIYIYIYKRIKVNYTKIPFIPVFLLTYVASILL